MERHGLGHGIRPSYLAPTIFLTYLLMNSLLGFGCLNSSGISLSVAYGTADACCEGVPPVVCCADGIELATLLNVPLVEVPSVVTATKDTIMMSDNRTAYSTAVGPSSEARKRRIQENNCMVFDQWNVRIGR